MVILRDITIIIKEPTKTTTGLRLRQPVKKEEYKEWMDINNVLIEEYAQKGNALKSIKVPTNLIPILTKELSKLKHDKRKTPRVVKAKIVL